MRSPITALCVVLTAILSACTYGGADISNPVTRKFTWFSFLEGADLKAKCRVGSNDRYRLVYNANYEEQVRIYEVEMVGGGRAQLGIRVLDGNTGNLLSLSSDDLLAPWRGRGGSELVNQSGSERLVAALRASGVGGAPPVGLEMLSEQHFWTVASCIGGTYGFTAYVYPSERWDRMTFDDVLKDLDTTGLPFPQPVRFVPNALRDNDVREGKAISFRLKVGSSGLVGATPFR